jgi:hypothetical protein
MPSVRPAEISHSYGSASTAEPVSEEFSSRICSKNLIERRWFKGAKHLDTLRQRVSTVIISLNHDVQLAMSCSVDARELKIHRSTSPIADQTRRT